MQVFGFFLNVYLCAYMCANMCARLQTPAKGLKMPFHPRRKQWAQSPNTSVTDPSFYCGYISLYPPHLPLYFIIFFLISSSHPSNLILHFSCPFFFYHLMATPLLLSVVLIFAHAYLFPSFLPPLSFIELHFLHMLSLSQSTHIPFLFFSLLFPVSVLSLLLFASIVT